MDLKQFLKENAIINQSELAKQMWPDNKSAKTKLSNKLRENSRAGGVGTFKLLPADEDAAKQALYKVAKDILDYVLEKK